jgi:hypothetical protein
LAVCLRMIQNQGNLLVFASRTIPKLVASMVMIVSICMCAVSGVAMKTPLNVTMRGFVVPLNSSDLANSCDIALMSCIDVVDVDGLNFVPVAFNSVQGD